MAAKNLSLAEFCALAKKDVDEFYSMWIASMAASPGQYPASMDAGEWHGQFESFMSSR